MDIYVGNLPHDMTEGELRELFEEFGMVGKARIITDRETRESRGFAFIAMSDPSEAQKAMEQLNERPVNGRKLVVNEARQKE